MEQMTPDLSTVYHALLTEIHSPQKAFGEPVWSPLESNYLDDSDSSSVESDDTITGGIDQPFLGPSPPPPSPDMGQPLLLSQNIDYPGRVTDTPSTSPLFVILDMLDIMLEQAQEQKQKPKPSRRKAAFHEIESDLETTYGRVEERLQPHRSLSQSGPSVRPRHHRLRPSRRSAPSNPPRPRPQPEPSCGLSPTQLMEMIDILMTQWPMVESAVLTTLHQNPGANINKYIHMLGKVLLKQVSGPSI